MKSDASPAYVVSLTVVGIASIGANLSKSLLDLRMLGPDGLTLLQRIQTKKLKTKIIVLTASEDEDECVQA